MPLLNPHITVFVPGYNAAPFVERCIRSIITQAYSYFDIVMVNDASTDNTGELMESWHWGSVIHNDENQKMPRNLTPMREGNPDHVILIVDADDFLPHRHALSIIAEAYEDPGLWLTYGSYTRFPDTAHMPNPALPYPSEVIAARSFRQYSASYLLYNHPLTFRRRLLQNIEDWELQDDDGRWFDAAYDHTIMMPMLEMSAPDHFRWLPDVLYTYNDENPLSEARVDEAGGRRVHETVNARRKRDAR